MTSLLRRVVFDSNAVDPFIDQPGTYEMARAAIDAGRLQILFTHVTIDELAETRDLDRRCRLLLAVIALGELVPTGAAAVGYSRLDHARLNDDVDVIEALRSGNIDHTRDALVAATAIHEQCALVTNEKRLTGRARERGIEVITPTALIAELQDSTERTEPQSS